MDKTEEIVRRARELADPVAIDLGLDIVDVEYRPEGGRWVLRVYIDKPGGVTLDDCARLSREFGTVLDVEDVIPQRYSLEVSSPGLDRRLKTEKDFQKFVGKRVRIRTREPIEGRKNFKAVIEGASGSAVTVSDETGRRWTIELSKIERANLVAEI